MKYNTWQVLSGISNSYVYSFRKVGTKTKPVLGIEFVEIRMRGLRQDTVNAEFV